MLTRSESFTIANPTIEVTSPRGEGIVFSQGDRITIAWKIEHIAHARNLRGTIYLLFPDGGTRYICNNINLADRSFVWRLFDWSACGGWEDDPLAGTLTTPPPRGSGFRIGVRFNRPYVSGAGESTPFAVE